MNRIINGCFAALLAMSSLLATGTAGAGGGSTTTTTTSLNETRIDTVEYDLRGSEYGTWSFTGRWGA